MKMRELEAETGVNRETIRVYFRHNLLPEPSRPKPNSADYDKRHVQAIKAVRKLQRESGLTLEQIRKVMSGHASGQRVEAGAFQHLEQLLAARVGYDEGLVSIKSLTATNPHAKNDARLFASVNIVTIVKSDEGDALSLTDSRLLEAWGQMRAAGFVEDVGFSPDILDFYVEASEFVAAHEARAFFDRTEGRIDEDDAASMLQVALPTMLDFFGLLRLKAFMRNLHKATATSNYR